MNQRLNTIKLTVKAQFWMELDEECFHLPRSNIARILDYIFSSADD